MYVLRSTIVKLLSVFLALTQFELERVGVDFVFTCLGKYNVNLWKIPQEPGPRKNCEISLSGKFRYLHSHKNSYLFKTKSG